MLAETGLHPEATAALFDGLVATERAGRAIFCHSRKRQLAKASKALVRAREMIATTGRPG